MQMEIGESGDEQIVRNGEDKGKVKEVLDVKGNNKERIFMREKGFEDDGEIIMRRIKMGEGRKSVLINDKEERVEIMRDMGKRIVEINGKNDEREMIEKDMKRKIIEDLGGIEEKEMMVRERKKEWSDEEREIEKKRERVEKEESEGDYMS